MKEKLKERKTLFQAFTLLNVEGTDVIDIQLYKYLMAKLKVAAQPTQPHLTPDSPIAPHPLTSHSP